MAHPHHEHARKSFHAKVKSITGQTGAEYPPDRAARISDIGNVRESANKPEEKWVAAPPRQISNYGNVKE